MAYSPIPTTEIKQINYVIDGKMRWIGACLALDLQRHRRLPRLLLADAGIHRFTVEYRTTTASRSTRRFRGT